MNLSAASVTDLGLPATTAGLLRDHGLPPQALPLELVEDTLMADPERGRTVLGELRRLGIRTSIDDYGTGHQKPGDGSAGGRCGLPWLPHPLTSDAHAAGSTAAPPVLLGRGSPGPTDRVGAPGAPG